MFELIFHPAVKKDLKKIEKSVADEIRGRHFVRIKENPFAAENLLHIFKGLKSYHFKSGNTGLFTRFMRIKTLLQCF